MEAAQAAAMRIPERSWPPPRQARKGLAALLEIDELIVTLAAGESSTISPSTAIDLASETASPQVLAFMNDCSARRGSAPNFSRDFRALFADTNRGFGALGQRLAHCRRRKDPSDDHPRFE